MEKRIIVSGVNDNPHYMDCMRAMVSSLAKNAPGERVWLLLLGCSEGYGQELCKRNPNVSIVWADGKPGATHRIYQVHKFVLENVGLYEKVLWLDNDTIIRKPLDGIWDDVAPNSLKIWRKKNDKKSHRFQAGVSVVGSGEHTKAWLKDVMKRESVYFDRPGSQLDGHGSPHWMVSQTYLYKCFTENGNIKHLQLSKKYNDSKFKGGSVIWHCKSSHFDEEKFQKEFKEYL
jgi:alpha-N-acetylglucosamine transferase